jgi:hypothetical protein
MDAVRPAEPHQPLQQPRRLVGQLVIVFQQHLELVQDRENPRRSPGTGR